MIDAVEILMKDLLDLAVTTSIKEFADLVGNEALQLLPVSTFDSVLAFH